MATTPASAATPQLATIDVPAEKMASASLSYPFNIAWFSEYFHEVGEMGGADGLNLKFASSVCKDPEALPNLVKEIRKDSDYTNLKIVLHTQKTCAMEVFYAK
ncbi:MAG: hypothetical protein DI628_02260 [Blastochloris viridis]|uniref:Uncharacterized protein n=1 Tax=Blastochloris viridis TaxID=1079 RepID=A0A6N4RBR7_BLAVI|nr:MAG: hypothetical protein DI628_02260 [Blastochloris viridis]